MLWMNGTIIYLKECVENGYMELINQRMDVVPYKNQG